MKLSVLTVPLQGMPAREAFTYLSKLGVDQVEIGTGGYTNDNHLKPSVYLNDPAKRQSSRPCRGLNLGISALSCHGNPCIPTKSSGAITMYLSTPAVLLKSWGWIRW